MSIKTSNHFTAAVITGLALTFSSPINAEENPDQKQAYQELTQRLLQPSGFWVQDNEDFAEGGEAPKFWLMAYRSGPGGQSLLSNVYMVSGDDTCAFIAHFIYYLDQEQGKIQRSGMLGNGKMVGAPMTYMGEGEYVSIVKIQRPDGDATMRDTGKFVDENKQSATAHFLNAETGNWDYADTRYWTRAGEDFQNPCA